MNRNDLSSYEKLILEAYKDQGSFEEIEKSYCLNYQEKVIIMQHYRDQKSMPEIAEAMGISRQRAYQIRAKAMEGVRAMLSAPKYNTSINYDDLSKRCRNALMRNRLETAEDIIKYVDECGCSPEIALQTVRNIGAKSAREICRLLRRV